MAIVYSTSLKNANLANVVSAIGSAGKIEIGTAGMASVLAVIELGNPAGTVAGGVLTFSGFPRSDLSADASGTAAEARIRTSGNVDVITGITVGTSGTDIILDSVAILAGQTVTLTAASITHG